MPSAFTIKRIEQLQKRFGPALQAWKEGRPEGEVFQAMVVSGSRLTMNSFLTWVVMLRKNYRWFLPRENIVRVGPKEREAKSPLAMVLRGASRSLRETQVRLSNRPYWKKLIRNALLAGQTLVEIARTEKIAQGTVYNITYELIKEDSEVRHLPQVASLLVQKDLP